MLTVKQVTKNFESIHPAKSVHLNTDRPMVSLQIIEPNGSVPIELTGGGTIYVMNEQGKTVATYHLDAPFPADA